MTLDDALLWLNDRLGRSVTIYVAVQQDDDNLSVFHTVGDLRHWTEGKRHIDAAAASTMAGLYDLGGGSWLDLTIVRPLEITTSRNRDEDECLTIRLDERTTLEVVEHADPDA
jgi:hypothetical protein